MSVCVPRAQSKSCPNCGVQHSYHHLQTISLCVCVCVGGWVCRPIIKSNHSVCYHTPLLQLSPHCSNVLRFRPWRPFLPLGTTSRPNTADASLPPARSQAHAIAARAPAGELAVTARRVITGVAHVMPVLLLPAGRRNNCLDTPSPRSPCALPLCTQLVGVCVCVCACVCVRSCVHVSMCVRLCICVSCSI